MASGRRSGPIPSWCATTSAISTSTKSGRLRERYLRREFPKIEYAGRVDDLRRRYPVLALQPREFIEP